MAIFRHFFRYAVWVAGIFISFQLEVGKEKRKKKTKKTYLALLLWRQIYDNDLDLSRAWELVHTTNGIVRSVGVAIVTCTCLFLLIEIAINAQSGFCGGCCCCCCHFLKRCFELNEKWYFVTGMNEWGNTMGKWSSGSKAK